MSDHIASVACVIWLLPTTWAGALQVLAPLLCEPEDDVPALAPQRKAGWPIGGALF